MAGTKEGALKGRDTNRRKYGEDYYCRIGAIGGKKGNTGGFYADVICKDKNCSYAQFIEPHFIRECAGYKGGKISKRGKKKYEA